MKKPIDQIKPNPHRNFDIYPIGESQVKLLMESINDVGMFVGLPARKVGDFYEQACGHHRIEALIRTGATHVDLAVNDYTDEEMLKIMIRENSTQRGHENFGAVLDSVGAVLVAFVKDIYREKSLPDGDALLVQGRRTPRQNLENGQGVGIDSIKKKESSLVKKHIETALKTFRNTGTYLHLLKKGGLPEEFWHLYDKKPKTTVEAVAMFPKPSHAAAWTKCVQDPLFQERFTVDQHPAMVAKIMRENGNGVTVTEIKHEMKGLVNPNVDLTPDEPKNNKSLDEKADIVTKSIKALLTKTENFLKEKGEDDCYIDNIDAIIDLLIEKLEELKKARTQITINI